MIYNNRDEARLKALASIRQILGNDTLDKPILEPLEDRGEAFWQEQGKAIQQNLKSADYCVEMEEAQSIEQKKPYQKYQQYSKVKRKRVQLN